MVKYIALCALILTPATQLLCMQEQVPKNSATPTLRRPVTKYSCTQVLVKSAAMTSALASGLITGMTTMTATKIAMAAVQAGVVAAVEQPRTITESIVNTILQSPVDISLFTGLSGCIGGIYFGYNGVIWSYKGIRYIIQKQAKNAAARAKITRTQEEHTEQ